ncbi:uncharacterized protein LOC103569155 [Caerostris darwini]|uniref:Uncharacterized protein LOC103569155, partial n=1 Tax=Caerostris darwini TaxID=1538125 RepID=A0AAV4NK77_9ARAC|nr:uncharacterized protein LOC103569155 [Caerostris darwini]
MFPDSVFGWVILGKTKGVSQTVISNQASCKAVEFPRDKFWQLEEISNTKPCTQEEIACENHFIQTFSRDSTGRFADKFSFRESSVELVLVCESKAFNIPISQSHFHTDSTIVLAWIGSHGNRWKTFAANRVAKTRLWSSLTQWHHVNGNENPGRNLATRGVSSSTRVKTSLRLYGPKFICDTFYFHPISSVPTLNYSVPTLNDLVPEKRSKILSLTPIVDYSSILKVGGRLRQANIAYGHKLQMLLPTGHILTDLIDSHYHKILLHAGPQLVLSSIQEQYWIIEEAFLERI